eukprot:TRINITY_DN32526_c0_g1_i2.p1 TRINITY_DN32526_c0_g1~~TRINITY_DN32526_c0_g1_i2.p1  ORF type:complete len:586 (+),score=97.72 TRINITY_DN32526_c0_g1_i2:96-1853(+)
MRVSCAVAFVASALHRLDATQVKRDILQAARLETDLQQAHIDEERQASLSEDVRLAVAGDSTAAASSFGTGDEAVFTIASQALDASDSGRVEGLSDDAEAMAAAAETSGPSSARDVSLPLRRRGGRLPLSKREQLEIVGGDVPIVGPFPVTAWVITAAAYSFCALTFGILAVVVILLRLLPAPKNGIELVHLASVAVDPEFTLGAVIGRCLRAFALNYITYLMYPGRVYNLLKREPHSQRVALPFFILAPIVLPLILIGACVRHIFKPHENLEKIGLQADGKEACEAERRQRGNLARFFHALYFYMAMWNNKIWSGSRSPAQSCFLSKDAWRKVLEKAGAYVPREVGRWNANGAEKMTWAVDALPEADVVVKPERGCLGEGSACFKYGVDFKTKEDLIKKVEEFMEGEPKAGRYAAELGEGASDYLLLERVMPDERGVHLLEVCTAKDANGCVGVVWMTYFLDSTSFTSHECPSRYRVNASTYKIEGGEQWFRRRAMNDNIIHASRRFGEDVPRAREACELAIRAHEEELQTNPERKFLGWDCMFTAKDGPCFFEGNTMELRMGRSFYSSWTTVWLILRTFTPPL